MFKIILSLITFSSLSYSSLLIVPDDLDMSVRETRSGVKIVFEVITHFESSRIKQKREFNEHKCKVFDNRTGILLSRKHIKTQQYGYTYFDIPLKMKNLKSLKIICHSKVLGRNFSSSEQIDLISTINNETIKKEKVLSNSNQTHSYIKTNFHTTANLKYKYKHSPNLFINGTKMYKITSMSFRNSKEDSLIIEAVNGNFILKIKDLKDVELSNISKKIRKKLTDLAQSDIKYSNETNNTRIKFK